MKRLPFLDHPLSKQDREDLLIIAIATGALIVLAAGLYLWSKAL